MPVLVQQPTEKLDTAPEGSEFFLQLLGTCHPPTLLDVVKTIEPMGKGLQFQFSHLLFTSSK